MIPAFFKDNPNTDTLNPCKFNSGLPLKSNLCISGNWCHEIVILLFVNVKNCRRGIKEKLNDVRNICDVIPLLLRFKEIRCIKLTCNRLNSVFLSINLNK